jgi:hypothetical protein
MENQSNYIIHFDRLVTKLMLEVPMTEKCQTEKQVEKYILQYIRKNHPNCSNVVKTVEYNEITNEGKIWDTLFCVGNFYLYSDKK